MSWITQVQDSFLITTGDGKEYRPQWMNAQKQVEYNIAEFDFPNIPGTLVNRQAPRGTRYNLELFIQGENHLEDSRAFEVSANDSRPWTISHPLYGRIVVQPVSLTFDNTRFNISKITGTIIETILEDFPKASEDPAAKIQSDKEELDESFVAAFDIIPNTSDINKMSENNTTLYNEGAKAVTDNVQAEDYFNLFNTANAKILNATSEPLAAIRAMQDVINAPFEFQISVENRINTLVNQFESLSGNIENILSRNEKKIYENNAGEVISGIAMAASTPQEGDYESREDVLSVVEKILNQYDQYVATLDTLQSDNGGSPDSFIPDAQAMIQLNDLIIFTVSNLFEIAISAKQERSIILENDSNVIILAHRFYGLEADDNTIDYLIATNNIGLNELLNVRKGRTIKYYI